MSSRDGHASLADLVVLLIVAGAALVVFGAYLFDATIGVIVAGALLIVGGVLVALLTDEGRGER